MVKLWLVALILTVSLMSVDGKKPTKPKPVNVSKALKDLMQMIKQQNKQLQTVKDELKRDIEGIKSDIAYSPCQYANCPPNAACEVKDGRASCVCLIGDMTIDGTCETEKGCPSGFISIGPNCYYFSNTTTTRNAAIKACYRKGVALVSINSGAENERIVQYLSSTSPESKSHWIYLDASTSVWGDGSRLSFTPRWQSSTRRDCTTILGIYGHNPIPYQYWCPTSCVGNYRYICKQTN